MDQQRGVEMQLVVTETRYRRRPDGPDGPDGPLISYAEFTFT